MGALLTTAVVGERGTPHLGRHRPSPQDGSRTRYAASSPGLPGAGPGRPLGGVWRGRDGNLQSRPDQAEEESRNRKQCGGSRAGSEDCGGAEAKCQTAEGGSPETPPHGGEPVPVWGVCHPHPALQPVQPEPQHCPPEGLTAGLACQREGITRMRLA